MGRRGPPPDPTAIRLIKGNPGKRPINKAEPKPEAKVPDCPEHLNEVARGQWDKLVPVLLGMKVLTEADQIALANLCQAYATLIEAQNQMAKTGILYKTNSGHIQQSPLLSIINGQVHIVNSLLREFGLTPSARTRVSVASGEEERPGNAFARLGT
jgi:P27 family predicted phage terminase small subunit